MGKKLRAAVERLCAKPTPTNRAAFENSFVFAALYTPLRSAPKGRKRKRDTTSGPNGESMLLVYVDGDAVLGAPGVSTAGGGGARAVLERARKRGIGIVVAAGHRKKDARAFIARDEVEALLARTAHEDPVLGLLVWAPGGNDDEEGFWEFEFAPKGGRPATGVLVPGRKWDPLAPKELQRIRKTVAWVRRSDRAIRAHVAAGMWDEWVEGFDGDEPTVPTPAAFRDWIRLEVLRFEPNGDIYVVYDDEGLLDGYGIHQHITAGGGFVGGPYMG